MARTPGEPRCLRRRAGAVAATIGLMMFGACGLPGDGSVRTVDDDAVPYGLLQSDGPAAPSSSPDSEAARAPGVFWVVGDRLVRQATGEVCAERPEVLVGRLLSTLALGPSDDARAAGRSSAIPPGSGLRLIGIDNGTVEVDIEAETSLSAERLPLAVGQVVLTVSSAPTVRSVVLMMDGEPVQVPLPQGELTGGPVTAEDYVELMSGGSAAPGAVGCPGP